MYQYVFFVFFVFVIMMSHFPLASAWYVHSIDAMRRVSTVILMCLIFLPMLYIGKVDLLFINISKL